MPTYEVTSPDGKIFEVTAPEGASEQDVLSYAQSQFGKQEVLPQEPAKEKLYGGGKVSQTRSALAGAGDIATMGFSDEIKAGLQGLVRGGLDPNITIPQAYDFFLNKARQEGGQLQEENPKTYLAGQIAGGLGTAVAMPSTITRGVSQLAGKTLPKQLATMAGVGGVSGGTHAFGSGEGGAQERLADVPSGATYGVFGGLFGVGGAKAIGGLAERALKAFSKKAPTITKGLKPEIAQERLIQSQEMLPAVPNVPKAISKVGGQLSKDFGADLDVALDLYKKGDISLAELYGKRTSSLAQGAAVYPSGRAVAEDFLGKKTAGSYDRVLSSIRKNISGVDNYFTNADDLLNVGRLKASPQYAKAYQDVITDKNVIAIPEVQDALNKAYKKFPSELQDASPDSIQALDYAKRILDDQIGKAQRAGESNFARSRTMIKNQLLEAMDNASPSYKKARSIAGDYLSIDNAMEQGRQALKTDSEILQKTYKSLSEPEKQAYKIGLGKAIRDEVGKVSEGANPYKRILGSPEKQKRISQVLSPEEYVNFERSLKAEDRLFQLRNKVLGGSPTADKLEAQKLIESGAIDSITGVPQKTFIDALLQFKTKLLDGLNDNTAAKVSEILYETDPIKKLQIIDGLKGSKDFTQQEKELVKRAYSLIAPRYDALKVSGMATGGAVSSQMAGEE